MTFPSIFEQPLNRNICIYQHVTAIQSFSILNPAPSQSISSNPFYVYWRTPSGADVYDVGTASLSSCADFTPLVTGVGSSGPSVSFANNGSKYICVRARSNFGLASVMAPGVLVTVSITPGPITSNSTLSYPPMTYPSSQTATLTSRDSFGMPLTTGGATVTFTSNNSGVATVTGGTTDHNDGTYTATINTSGTGTFILSASVTAGTSFSISSVPITVP